MTKDTTAGGVEPVREALERAFEICAKMAEDRLGVSLAKPLANAIRARGRQEVALTPPATGDGAGVVPTVYHSGTVFPAPAPAGVEEAAEFVAKTAEDVHAAIRSALKLCQIPASECLDENLDRQKLRLSVFRALEMPTINSGQAAITARRLAAMLARSNALENGPAVLADAHSKSDPHPEPDKER